MLNSEGQKIVDAFRTDTRNIFAGSVLVTQPLFLGGALISLNRNIPFSIIRKRPYGLDGEIEIVETTGYSTTKMYIKGVKPGMKVTIVDDVVSTGGTSRIGYQGPR